MGKPAFSDALEQVEEVIELGLRLLFAPSPAGRSRRRAELKALEGVEERLEVVVRSAAEVVLEGGFADEDADLLRRLARHAKAAEQQLGPPVAGTRALPLRGRIAVGDHGPGNLQSAQEARVACEMGPVDRTDADPELVEVKVLVRGDTRDEHLLGVSLDQ